MSSMYFEYGVTLINCYAFINGCSMVRENIALQGKNLSQRKYQYRYNLLEQVTDWDRRCMLNCYEQKKLQDNMYTLRSHVSIVFSKQ